VKVVDGDIETHQKGAGIWWEEEERQFECKLRTYQDALREERRLWVFENRVLRRIFGPKRDEETGGWRKLHMRSFKACTLLHVLLE
jgi:hypothetical protein